MPREAAPCSRSVVSSRVGLGAHPRNRRLQPSECAVTALARHGIPSAYNRGCRCDECRECNRLRQRRYLDEFLRNARPVSRGIWALIKKNEDPGGCWLWMGALTDQGYGKAMGMAAPRAVYLSLVGPIPTGLELDHLCRVPRCVNPAHLDPVTRRENVRRRDLHKLSCIHGHAYTPENTYIPRSGKRGCRICRTARSRESRLRQIERKEAAS